MTDIDLSTYTRDSCFYPEIPLLLTIKSFDLQAIRKRYLASRKSGSTRTGSVERREVAIGGICSAVLHKGKTHNFTIIAKLLEPRGLDINNDIFAFSSENKVFVVEKNTIITLENDWFSYIHTVQLRNEMVLISSSGFDAFFEWDYHRNVKCYEWFAWEHGFNRGYDAAHDTTIFLCRCVKQAACYTENNIPHIYISDPRNQVLPTAQRAAFINSVVYDTAGIYDFLATFFHEGSVYGICKNNGKAERLLDKLNNPHGGRRIGNHIMATSTGDGRVVICTHQERQHINFANVPGKPQELGAMEWLQNSMYVDDKTVITIDSNRNAFIIFNMEKKIYDIIPFDSNLAIQDFVYGTIESSMRQLIREIEINDRSNKTL